MKFLFQLSGEHPDLPRAEIFAVLEGEGISFEGVYSRERFLVMDLDTEETDFVNRLAMTRKTARLIALSNNIRETGLKIAERISKEKTIAIRSRSHTLEEELGAELFVLGYHADLEKPDVEILCFGIDGKYLAGINIPMRRDFNSRRPQFRPFFHPTSMHPKLARVLVNLARVRKNDILLDPFCGTGGILIEAGLMGLEIMGSDIDRRMVEGCKKNLKFFDIDGKIKKADALKLWREFKEVDAIVTDPPYARSSFVTEKNIGDFYRKFLSSAFNILRHNGHLVLVVPKGYSLNTEKFDLIEEFQVRVHKSLTRKILVMKKPS
ncbi:MAG: hypothetical protein DRO76_03660 [Candidatus Altiarchaeales archaeon]|nr:MAG: hypothetical protein DRO76_03660 [Candidatus Altiarchaeales archaeon]HDI72818.1 hypothetical protein [Candidatus Altiarchaeales archaeon]